MGTTLVTPVNTSDVPAYLKYQNDLVRTGHLEPLGRMQKIAIAPSAGWNPQPNDPFMAKFGRLIDLRDKMLPIAQSLDRTMVLCPAPLLNQQTNRVELPSVPQPNWVPPPLSKDEIEGVEKIDACGKKYREAVPFGAARQAPMIPQNLRDRAEGKLYGSDFFVFSPVVSVMFQPELNNRLVGDAWILAFSFNPADNTHPTLLIDEHTGEMHFYGGRYEIITPGVE